MEKNIVNVETKENKKITVKFVFIMIGAFCFGGFLGVGLGILRKNFSTFFNNNIISIDMIIELVSYASMILIIIIFFTIIISSLILISKSKKLIAIWDEEDDDMYIKIDKILSKALNLNNICFILNTILFGLACYNLINNKHLLFIFISVVFYILTIFSSIFFQGKVVNITKELNPEKKGNVLDMKFQKSWFNSCDEAERHIIYESSYNSFKFMNIIYNVVVLLLSCVGMFFKIGIFPIILAGILYLMHVISYTINVQKSENKRNSK